MTPPTSVLTEFELARDFFKTPPGPPSKTPPALPRSWVPLVTERFGCLEDSDQPSRDHQRSTAPLWTPQAGPQTQAYESDADEILYGGEPGGGKSDWLLGHALTKHVRSHLFRRDAGQLGELTDRLREITTLDDGSAIGRVTESPRPLWRCGAKRLEMAGIANEADAFKWQGRAGDFKAFDEVTQFSKTQYLTVSGWGRSSTPGQKVQTAGTCNPPVDEDALWVVERWAPWLDPTHENPAASGEIRWFAMVDGEDTECESGSPFEHNGETVYPSSRTFIRARLADNAYLGDDYRRKLDALPEPMRTIFKTSDFVALLQTSHPFQVIPTGWIRAAQQRWTPEPPLIRGSSTEHEPQSAVALDVAEGGRDRCVVARRHSDWIAMLETVPGIKTPHAEDAVALVEPKLVDTGYAIVDSDGVGGKAYGILFEKYRWRIRAFQGVKPTSWREDAGRGTNEFFNVRAAAWWCAREALDPKNERKVALPPGNDLLTELAAPRWEMRGQKIKIEEKSGIVSRLGRSPDLGDAVVMVLWDGDVYDFESIRQSQPLGWQSGTSNGAPTTAPAIPSSLKGKTPAERLALLMGEWQSVGTR
jgi:hypothetical protein